MSTTEEQRAEDRLARFTAAAFAGLIHLTRETPPMNYAGVAELAVQAGEAMERVWRERRENLKNAGEPK